jgi:hypothetical protein
MDLPSENENTSVSEQRTRNSTTHAQGILEIQAASVTSPTLSERVLSLSNILSLMVDFLGSTTIFSSQNQLTNTYLFTISKSIDLRSKEVIFFHLFKGAFIESWVKF